MQARGNVSRERDGFALNVYAAARFEKSPVRIQTPQKTVIFSRRHLALAGFAGMHDLRDPRAVGTALRTNGIELLVVNLIFGVEHHRNDFLSRQPEINLEILADMLQSFRF